MNVFLYSRRISDEVILTVGYDDVTFEITHKDFADNTSDLYPWADGDVITSACITGSTTLATFKVSFDIPYATIEYTTNSTACGYVPSSCDVFYKSIAYTDETTAGANDGTITVFAAGSYSIVSYTITGPLTAANTTGVFINVHPGTYVVSALDSNGCTVTANITIHSATGRTGLKYVLQFNSVIGNNVCRVEFYDQKHSWPQTDYPKYLIGSPKPLVKKTTNSNEAKEAAILPTSLDMEVLYTGNDFTVEEFSLADERTWYIKYFINGAIDFQGWLLPDEIQDFYEDANYFIKLTATDGLLSLKGVDYGDASGIQQYGVYAWAQLVKNCLDKLDYDYGLTKLVSSLQFNSYDASLWTKIGTWADLFYDDSGLPKDTYSVLELLLSGLGLSLFQDKGVFCLVDWNDIYWIQNSIKIDDWKRAQWVFNADMTSVAQSNTFPATITIGQGLQLKPVNPVQSLNYDKAYNVLEADINFTYFTLLYPNPSFEIGAVQGSLPGGWDTRGTISAYVNKDTTAYVGDWTFRLIGYNDIMTGSLGQPLSYFSTGNWAQPTSPGYAVDQPNKTVNLSFYWRPIYYSDSESVIPAYVIVFIRDSDGVAFVWTDSPLNITSGDLGWVQPSYDAPFNLQGTFTTDYLQWNNVTVKTTATPGTGHIFVRLYGAVRVDHDNVLINDQGTTPHTIDIDQFEITLGDGSDQYNKQTGEKHTVTNKSNFAKAEKKSISQSLFTYPSNKRVAGNVFFGTTYETGVIANNWSYALSTPLITDRLPAVVIRQLAKQYQQPQYIFEGDVLFSSISYFAAFILTGYTDEVFMPFTIERDDRNGIAHLVLVAIDDSSPQNTYIYTGKYEKSARRIS